MPSTSIDEQLIASRIRASVTRTGLGTEDVAQALGVTRRAVEHWFNASPAWLMGRDA